MHSANGLDQSIAIARGHSGVMTVHGESAVMKAQFRSVSGPGRPMVNAVNGVVVKPGLEPLRVFPQIMQQPGQLGLGAEAERGSEAFRQIRDITQMLRKKLPFATFVRSVRVVSHLVTCQLSSAQHGFKDALHGAERQCDVGHGR